MTILTFGCPKCSTPMSFEYADYDLKDFVKSSTDNFEVLTCSGCNKVLKTVPWIAVFDEESEKPVTFV